MIAKLVFIHNSNHFTNVFGNDSLEDMIEKVSMWRFSLAVSFLTILPVRIKKELQSGDLGRSGSCFSWVGIIIGAFLCLGWILFFRFFPPLLASALVIVLWAVITGGLHLDGLADCGDGLLSPAKPEHRLEIMKDPRLGSFGGISLILFLLLKLFSVDAISQNQSWTTILVPLILAPVVGRWLILLAARQPAARPTGLGAEFKAGLSPQAWILAAIPLGILTLLGGWTAFAAIMSAHLVAFIIFLAARRRLGGLTGDVYGLTIEIGELIVLLIYSIHLA
jgi:adenosylcobinamide-GDP ribazoletransferase